MTVACPLRLVKIALVVPPAVVTAVDIMLKLVIFPGSHYFLIFIRPSLSVSIRPSLSVSSSLTCNILFPLSLNPIF